MSKETILPSFHQGKADLLSTFNAVPDDKLNWKPLDNGRTILDLFGEAAQTPSLLTAFLKVKGQLELNYEVAGQYINQEARAKWSKEEALAALEANHSEMIAAIEALTEEELAVPVAVAMAGETPLPLSVWTLIVYRTYVSRFAQINYIQTLYGDFKFHNF